MIIYVNIIKKNKRIIYYRYEFRYEKITSNKTFTLVNASTLKDLYRKIKRFDNTAVIWYLKKLIRKFLIPLEKNDNILKNI